MIQKLFIILAISLPCANPVNASLNGSLTGTGEVVNRKPNGEVSTYHQNGKLKEQAFYMNGKLHGNWKVYSETGFLFVNEYYMHGKLHCLFRYQ